MKYKVKQIKDIEEKLRNIHAQVKKFFAKWIYFSHDVQGLEKEIKPFYKELSSILSMLYKSEINLDRESRSHLLSLMTSVMYNLISTVVSNVDHVVDISNKNQQEFSTKLSYFKNFSRTNNRYLTIFNDNYTNNNNMNLNGNLNNKARLTINRCLDDNKLYCSLEKQP